MKNPENNTAKTEIMANNTAKTEMMPVRGILKKTSRYDINTISIDMYSSPSHLDEDNQDGMDRELSKNETISPKSILKKHSKYALRDETSDAPNEDDSNVIDMTHVTNDMWAPNKVEIDEKEYEK